MTKIVKIKYHPQMVKANIKCPICGERIDIPMYQIGSPVNQISEIFVCLGGEHEAKATKIKSIEDYRNSFNVVAE